MFRKPRTDLESFVLYLRAARGLAEGTIKIYRRHCADFLAEEPKDLSAWLVNRSASASSFTQAASSIKAWGRFTKDRRLLGELEDIDRPKKPKGLPKPVADLEAKLALLPSQARWGAILLRETGMRLSEAYSVNTGDLVPHQLLIRGKGSKDRLVLLTPAAREALLALDGRMPWSKRWLQREFQEVGMHPHALRHTFGTELAASGCDLGEIQDLMGHASPATTRVYAAYSTDRLRAAQDRRAAFVQAQG